MNFVTSIVLIALFSNRWWLLFSGVDLCCCYAFSISSSTTTRKSITTTTAFTSSSLLSSSRSSIVIPSPNNLYSSSSCTNNGGWRRRSSSRRRRRSLYRRLLLQLSRSTSDSYSEEDPFREEDDDEGIEEEEGMDNDTEEEYVEQSIQGLEDSLSDLFRISQGEKGEGRSGGGRGIAFERQTIPFNPEEVSDWTSRGGQQRQEATMTGGLFDDPSFIFQVNNDDDNDDSSVIDVTSTISTGTNNDPNIDEENEDEDEEEDGVEGYYLDPDLYVTASSTASDVLNEDGTIQFLSRDEEEELEANNAYRKLTEILLSEPDVIEEGLIDESDDEEELERLIQSRLRNSSPSGGAAARGSNEEEEEDMYRKVFENEQGFLNQSEVFKHSLGGDVEAKNEALMLRRGADYRKRQKEALDRIEEGMLELERSGVFRDEDDDDVQEGVVKCMKCGCRLSEEEVEHNDAVRKSRNGGSGTSDDDVLCMVCYAERFVKEGVGVTGGGGVDVVAGGNSFNTGNARHVGPTTRDRRRRQPPFFQRENPNNVAFADSRISQQRQRPPPRPPQQQRGMNPPPTSASPRRRQDTPPRENSSPSANRRGFPTSGTKSNKQHQDGNVVDNPPASTVTPPTTTRKNNNKDFDDPTSIQSLSRQVYELQRSLQSYQGKYEETQNELMRLRREAMVVRNMEDDAPDDALNDEGDFMSNAVVVEGEVSLEEESAMEVGVTGGSNNDVDVRDDVGSSGIDNVDRMWFEVDMDEDVMGGRVERPWVEVVDPDSGDVFFWNEETEEMRWEL